ncbi:MAG: HemK2/MTQ2 family protein methyltransferase [Candidatus Aenigmatarchaeota archaeon]
MLNIYQPAEDSFLLEKYVKKLARGKVLDMGTGSGIQAKAALERTDSVTAVDINPEVIEHCKSIKNVEFIQSDLFSSVTGKFDTIIFNAPYLPEEGPKDPALDGGKKGHETIERFLSQVKEFLSKDGIILLVFSSFTNKEKVDHLIVENGFRFEELERIHFSFENIYCYKITISF